MKFSQVDNIWSVDVRQLSNADRGRIYFERAKQVVSHALSTPRERAVAIAAGRFRRRYLAEKIGAQPAVATQNPRIRQLLIAVDKQLADEIAE